MRWAEPPEDGRSRLTGPYRWTSEAAELRANPKRWGIIWERISTPAKDKYGQNLQTSIARGRLKAFQPRGTYQATKHTESDDDGIVMVRVYARYVGEG